MEDRLQLSLPLIFFFALSLRLCLVSSVTDPNDVAVLREFERGLKNPELLKWPADNDDPCGTPKWGHVFCKGERVSQIQVQDLGLQGPLPRSISELSMLDNVGFQRNKFSGALPSFKGLSNLRFAYLDFNEFDSIPSDFFDGLDSLEVLALQGNGFNLSTGWMFPSGLAGSSQLVNLTCGDCNLVGPLPGFMGNMSSLQVLTLSGNSLSGEVSESFRGMTLTTLWLSNQKGGGLSGSIEVFTTMESLTELLLQGNQFSGKIPDSIGNLSSLKTLNLNGNQLAGPVPQSLASLELVSLDLGGNHLMGPIPEFKAAKVSYENNGFCQAEPGAACDPQVTALIEFLDGLNYPRRLGAAWTGNTPCTGWFGVSCGSDGKVTVINLPRLNLNGTLSPSLASLVSLRQLKLQGNNLAGPVPQSWTGLKALMVLDLSANNISPPLPKFGSSVKVNIAGNPLMDVDPASTKAPAPQATINSTSSPATTSSSVSPQPQTQTGNSAPLIGSTNDTAKSNSDDPGSGRSSRRSSLVPIVAPIAVAAAATLLVVPLWVYYCCTKKKSRGGSIGGSGSVPGSLVVHPSDPSGPDNTLKIVVANSSAASGESAAATSTNPSSGAHVIEAGNLVISVQVLRSVTKNFSPENEVGRGGFGVVYRGELDDGTKIAVKRMESGAIGSKALDEFQSEIAVLSKVRHRHLVSLLGYSVEGYERILVYEYMPQGALSKHLFHWKTFGLEPLSLKRRLNIALDVARGMEYLHNLAHQSFIHRDLKSSNILLGDDFRAKVSDFGLVKLAPDGEKSVVTRLAGTFGYLAPEYAVTGKITTKADVFSFGVVLMELLTGMMALDEGREEEKQYLAAWFWNIKSDKEKLLDAVDPSLEAREEKFESILAIAELAGHCTAREPGQRPDMGHAVNVLAPLVEKWTPLDDDAEEYSGIDYTLPLNQMVKGWQEAEGKEFSYIDLEDSKGSIPARPTGFADSFTSADGR